MEHHAAWNRALEAGPSSAMGGWRGNRLRAAIADDAVLYGVVRTHLTEFLAAVDAQTDSRRRLTTGGTAFTSRFSVTAGRC